MFAVLLQSIQLVIALGLLNVWLLRFHKSTAYRGGEAKNLIEEARPVKPARELFAQGLSFEDFLLPEDSFEWPFMGIEEYFTVFLMRDGALGVGLWLTPIASEMLDERELAGRLDILAELLSKIKNPNAALQVIPITEFNVR